MERPADPTEQSLWRPMRLLFAAMDDDIAAIYAAAHITGLKPSMVRELLRLHARSPMTITELAESVQRTHSATSQKVAAMRAAGLVRTTAGADARTRKITLTAKARRIIGKLAAEWRATEAALAELEKEIRTRSAKPPPTSRRRCGARASTTGSPTSSPPTRTGRNGSPTGHQSPFCLKSLPARTFRTAAVCTCCGFYGGRVA